MSSPSPAPYGPPHKTPDAPGVPSDLGRPWHVAAAVVLFAALWTAVMAYAAVQDGEGFTKPSSIAYGVFWTVVIGLWLWRVWRGGPMAIGRMVQLCYAIGALGLGFTIYMTYTFSDLFEDDDWTRGLPGAGFSLCLLLIAFLLSRRPVREWSQTRRPAPRR
ncbi:hypothetical protein [Spirillospora sp. CA-294931]|uniref:hypothetical protein n=1 Tax=Spirillospora sp. CA-294931 TaxID=3240042 RepID=UPI003D920032